MPEGSATDPRWYRLSRPRLAPRITLLSTGFMGLVLLAVASIGIELDGDDHGGSGIVVVLGVAYLLLAWTGRLVFPTDWARTRAVAALVFLPIPLFFGGLVLWAFSNGKI